jgi:hypothetical protein
MDRDQLVVMGDGRIMPNATTMRARLEAKANGIEGARRRVPCHRRPSVNIQFGVRI